MKSGIASTVNPYAGWHPITSDPEEIEAARRASDASLREFPYYLERYGERGRLFGASDGAWLVTLCEGDAGHAREQILWLGSVLSSRGMPRRLLERHLEVLHEELRRIRPRDAGRYGALLGASALLRELRERRVPEAEFRRLAGAFSARVGPEWSERLPGMGEILVSAVADEAEGLPKAVESVESWAADRSIFPDAWVEAVAATLAEARRSVSTDGKRQA